MRSFPMLATVERRLLLNYRVDPEVADRQLPAPFRPQLVDGFAVAGICLIRLGDLRPPGVPRAFGLRTENAAHRFAVEWDTPDGIESGVFIPRRDTDSRLSHLIGGRAFPGANRLTPFAVRETDDEVQIRFDGVDVHVGPAEDPWNSVLFPSLAVASRFFEGGSIGYSATNRAAHFEGLRLETNAWKVEAAHVVAARSSLFDDVAKFPPGSAAVDCALIMRGVPVTWRPLPQLRGEPRRTVRS